MLRPVRPGIRHNPDNIDFCSAAFLHNNCRSPGSLLWPAGPRWSSTASTTSENWWDTRWTYRWSTTAPSVDWSPELHSPLIIFIFDGPDLPLPPHFYVSLEKALNPLLIPASPSSASLNQLVWKQPAQKEGLFSPATLETDHSKLFLKGLRHTGAAFVWTLCCAAMQNTSGSLNFVTYQSQFFFLHHPAPVTTGNYLLVQEKILLGCNKGTIKGFFQIPLQPD